MIAGLKPYPEYKDSGVPWLGRIPGHWDVRRNGRLFSERKEVGFPDLPILEVSLKTGVRVRDFAGSKRKQIMSDRAKYKRALRGDVAYNMMRLWQGAVGTAPEDGLVSPAYVIARPHAGVDGQYYAYLFRTDAYMREVNKYSHGIVTDRNRLYWDEFKQMPSPYPPSHDQSAIVRFLRAVQRRIHLAIASKKRLIALLNEEKNRIIQDYITRGSAGSGQLKLSGIPWLTEIPEHWDSLRSKYLFREVDERSETGGEVHLSMSQRLGLVPSEQVSEKRLMSESYAGAKLCASGDLVLNRLKAHLGVFAVAPQQGLVSPDYTVFRSIRSLDVRYFELLYRTPACRIELRRRAKGIVEGFWRLYTDDFYDIRVPVPPVTEQSEIADNLGSALSKPNEAIARSEREIALIREYQARLIADLIFGQLDVRTAAERLPAEVEAPEAELVSDMDEDAEDVLEEVSEDA
jgi:type I restriction enzyme S subunit